MNGPQLVEVGNSRIASGNDRLVCRRGGILDDLSRSSNRLVANMLVSLSILNLGRQ